MSPDAASQWLWPRVLAHRCGGALAPENTLAGLEVAAACGCGGVEFDVMLTADQQPVLIHDETLTRTTDRDGRVAALTLDAVRRADAGCRHAAAFAGERVPTFAEAAARCRELGLAANVEIKPASGHDVATGARVAADAARLWAGSVLPPLLSSFSVAALAAAAQAAPTLPRALLCERLDEDWQARCEELGVIAVHADAALLERDQAAAVRAAGYRLAVYTVNDAQRAATLFDWGVDCVITDRPERVRPPRGRS